MGVLRADRLCVLCHADSDVAARPPFTAAGSAAAAAGAKAIGKVHPRVQQPPYAAVGGVGATRPPRPRAGAHAPCGGHAPPPWFSTSVALPAFPPRPPPLPPPLPGAAGAIVVAHALREQVRYYFGAENMPGDAFLRGRMDARGFVPLATIATFPRVRALDAPDVGTLAAALEHEASLELSADARAVRSRHSWALVVAPPPAGVAAAALAAPAPPPGTRGVGDALHLLGACPSLTGNRDRLWARVYAKLASDPRDGVEGVSRFLGDPSAAPLRLLLLLGADPNSIEGWSASHGHWPPWAEAATRVLLSQGVLDLWERRKALAAPSPPPPPPPPPSPPHPQVAAAAVAAVKAAETAATAAAAMTAALALSSMSPSMPSPRAAAASRVTLADVSAAAAALAIAAATAASAPAAATVALPMSTSPPPPLPPTSRGKATLAPRDTAGDPG